MQDLRDLPVSTESREDIDEFELALREFQTYTGDPIERIEQTLSRSPEFVLGHVFRSVNYCLTSERRFIGALFLKFDPSVECVESLKLWWQRRPAACDRRECS